MTTQTLHFNKGFFECGDVILNWLNSLDTSDMSVKEFRKELVHKILELKPDGRRTTTH